MNSQTPYGGLQVPGSGRAAGRLETPGGAPGSRYILPQFEERTSYGMKRLDPYTKLFEDRIIFLGVQVDDASADDIIAQHTGQTVDQIEADSDRDRWFTAEQAEQYGFVDHVVESATLAAGGGGTT